MNSCESDLSLELIHRYECCTYSANLSIESHVRFGCVAYFYLIHIYMVAHGHIRCEDYPGSLLRVCVGVFRGFTLL